MARQAPCPTGTLCAVTSSRPSAALTRAEIIASTNDNVERAMELVERCRDQNAKSIAEPGCQKRTGQLTERRLDRAKTGALNQNAERRVGTLPSAREQTTSTRMLRAATNNRPNNAQLSFWGACRRKSGG